MSSYPIYKYEDFFDEGFPFKMEHRNSGNLPSIFHSHENLQICYVIKGTCAHCIYNKKTVLVKGDAFSVFPYTEHRLEPIVNKEVEIIQIDFMPFFINERLNDFSKIDGFIDFAYIQPFLDMQDRLVPRLNVAPSSQLAVEQLITAMQAELTLKEDGYKLAIKANLLMLIVVIGREFNRFMDKEYDMKYVRIHRQGFYTAIGYMESNFCEKIALEDIASMAAMAPSYFSHIFRLAKGRSFIEHLNYLRINKAMELLSGCDMNITQICFSTGFNNIANFNRVFKRITGNTPSEYRNQILSGKQI